MIFNSQIKYNMLPTTVVLGTKTRNTSILIEFKATINHTFIFTSESGKIKGTTPCLAKQKPSALLCVFRCGCGEILFI